jgi:hypothetical protein
MGRTLVAKCLKILEEAGYIKRDKAPGPKGDLVNVFVLGKRKPFKKEDGMEVFYDFWYIDDEVGEEIYKDTISKF